MLKKVLCELMHIRPGVRKSSLSAETFHLHSLASCPARGPGGSET